jgi:hypothetical protein
MRVVAGCDEKVEMPRGSLLRRTEVVARGGAAIGERLRRVERALLGLPNVTGVGLGWKETRGEITDTPAWRVYVRPKLPADALRPAERVPARVDGLATDVLLACHGVPAAAVEAVARVREGALVSNLRAVLRDEPVDRGSSGLGTLGFLGLVNGTREREVVLVSNRHVLLAHGAGRGDPVYCPVVSSRGDSYVIRRDSLEPVGEILDEGTEDNHRFSYPGEPEDDYFVDCATARVLGEPELRPLVRRAARVHPLDVVGGRAPRVRKLGGASGTTVGRVVDVAAPVDAGDSTRLNNMLIRGLGASLLEPGDSGALVVTDADEAVGLIWGRSDRERDVAYACHIGPLLDRLDVTMLTRGLA